MILTIIGFICSLLVAGYLIIHGIALFVLGYCFGAKEALLGIPLVALGIYIFYWALKNVPVSIYFS